MKNNWLLFLAFFPMCSFAQNAAPLQKSSIWPIKKIKICFEKSTEIQRQWTQQAIEQSWEANCDIDFTDWCICDGLNYHLRISIVNDTTRPHAKRLGALNAYKPEALVLNSNWHQQGCGELALDKELCFKSVAVHEFGHALGFSHEHANPNCCQPPDKGGSDIIDPKSDDWILFDHCDENSVMSYCNDKYANHGILSPTDVLLVQQAYGSKDVVKNDILFKDNFSSKNSVFKPVKSYKNGSEIRYESYISNNENYNIHMPSSSGWGFTWLGLPKSIGRSFSSFNSTILSFDYDVVEYVDDYFSWGLIFDKNNVMDNSNCIGGNFYVLQFNNSESKSKIVTRVASRTNCEENTTCCNTIVNQISETKILKTNHVEIVKDGSNYLVKVNGFTTLKFTYKGNLNFSDIYFSKGQCAIDNVTVRKIN